MTREEALNDWLPIIRQMVKGTDVYEEALDMAIRALEKESTEMIAKEADNVKNSLMAIKATQKQSCEEEDVAKAFQLGLTLGLCEKHNEEDCISRQAAIVALDDRMSSLENVDMQIAMGFAKGIIHELPSVAPWPKMGRWIGVNPMVDTLMCSECGENIISEEFKSNYCPNCGAKMSEVEE